jgi:hypothetical protein
MSASALSAETAAWHVLEEEEEAKECAVRRWQSLSEVVVLVLLLQGEDERYEEIDEEEVKVGLSLSGGGRDRRTGEKNKPSRVFLDYYE